jgi:hypothetical protein
MAALHETTESIATKGVRHIIPLDKVAARACPAAAEGGKRSHAHADTSGVLKRLVV